MEKYQKIEKIGKGTYGIVYKVQDNLGCIYAMKKIRLNHKDSGIPSTTIREIALLNELRHTNIVRLYDVIYNERKLILVFEFLDQDLKKLLNVCEGGLDPHTIKSFLYQLLSGISYCHEKKILHRDLKPQNLLINREGYLKLCDFGLARAYGIPVRSYIHEVVTLWYRSPDMLLGCKNYSTPIDVWSVGCIFAEMATGQPLFPGRDTEDQLLQIFKVLGSPTLKTWPDIKNMPLYTNNFHIYPKQPLSAIIPNLDPDGLDLLSKMLEYDNNKRIAASQALKHIFFKDLNIDFQISSK